MLKVPDKEGEQQQQDMPLDEWQIERGRMRHQAEMDNLFDRDRRFNGDP